nr:hypothetical protein [Campylobacter armoricus]
MLNIDISIQTYTQILGIVVLAIGCILIEILPDKIGITKACVIFLNLFVFNIFYTKTLIDKVSIHCIFVCFLLE